MGDEALLCKGGGVGAEGELEAVAHGVEGVFAGFGGGEEGSDATIEGGGVAGGVAVVESGEGFELVGGTLRNGLEAWPGDGVPAISGEFLGDETGGEEEGEEEGGFIFHK